MTLTRSSLALTNEPSLARQARVKERAGIMIQIKAKQQNVSFEKKIEKLAFFAMRVFNRLALNNAFLASEHQLLTFLCFFHLCQDKREEDNK